MTQAEEQELRFESPASESPDNSTPAPKKKRVARKKKTVRKDAAEPARESDSGSGSAPAETTAVPTRYSSTPDDDSEERERARREREVHEQDRQRERDPGRYDDLADQAEDSGRGQAEEPGGPRRDSGRENPDEPRGGENRPRHEGRGGPQNQPGGGHSHRNKPGFQKGGYNKPNKFKQKGGGGPPGGGGGQAGGGGHSGGGSNKFQKNKPFQKQPNKAGKKKFGTPRSGRPEFDANVGELPELELFGSLGGMTERATEIASSGLEPVLVNELLTLPLMELVKRSEELGVDIDFAPNRPRLLDECMLAAFDARRSIEARGILETTGEGHGFVVFESDHYRVRPHVPFVPESVIKHYGIRRGQVLKVQIQPSGSRGVTPFVVAVQEIMDKAPEENLRIEPFEDLVPYYPTERMLLEVDEKVPWDNISNRVVDMLTPIGFGQRGLIVAPPRTGKTILLQGIANAIGRNHPTAHLIVLLVDERPEEVTDFKRQVGHGEVIASTFDESAESHVHAAEMVIEKARSMVQDGRDVIILLDSITRLARAYNTTMPSSGKILSGGVEASALQKPKRFFGSARNIEEGGSLTILGTALVETGSRMDEVIFEEFKGTGNMEIHLDRQLSDKRIFPAFNLERSGTRKEELLYHPDEMNKIYSLRRAMKGVPPQEAMEMLIQRVKKTKTNVEFLMSVNR